MKSNAALLLALVVAAFIVFIALDLTGPPDVTTLGGPPSCQGLEGQIPSCPSLAP